MFSTFGEPMAAIITHYVKRVIMEMNATTAQNFFTQKMDFSKKLILAQGKELLASVSGITRTG